MLYGAATGATLIKREAPQPRNGNEGAPVLIEGDGGSSKMSARAGEGLGLGKRP